MNFPLLKLRETVSTNNFIKENPDLFQENFTAVRTQKQTGGRGRYTRTWYSTSDDLVFSFIYYPAIKTDVQILTLYAGLAVYNALDLLTQTEHLIIKWPNDIYLGGKKICGILCELVHINNRPAVITGIGVNVNTEIYPEELLSIATSLHIATRRKFSLDNLLESIMESVQIQYSRISSPIDPDFISQWLRAATRSDFEYNIDNVKLRIINIDNSGYPEFSDKSGKIVKPGKNLNII